MFSEKTRPSLRLSLQITAINAGALILALILLIIELNNQYIKDEKILAREKTLLIWSALVNKDINSGIMEINDVYRSDLINSNKLYGVRITNNKNYTFLLEYPQSWSKHFNTPIIFESATSTSQPKKLKKLQNGKKTPLNLEVYSMSLSGFFIQILISIEERVNFLVSILKRGVAVIVGIAFLSFIIANVVINRVLRPLNNINKIIEQTIESQKIQQRLIITGRGEYARSQKNFNTMLDVIERQVNRLKQASVNLGHDIRTPLTRVRNQLEFILTTTNNKLVQKEVEKCLDFVDDIKIFAKQVLDLSEIESGLVIIPEEAINIAKELEEVLEMYVMIAEEKKISINTDINPLLTIYIDRIRLQQLIGNLLDNAVKFSPLDSTIYIIIQQDKKKIKITVEDQGVGISKENLKYICLPSWKNNSVDYEKNSAGFGLAIVESIVQAYKGTLHITSEQQQGTKIVIII